MGLVGGPLVLWLLYRAFRHPPGPAPPSAAELRSFWMAMAPFCFVMGIAVVGERDAWGSAHLTLLPLTVLGLTLLAASFPLPRLAALALLAGCVIDFSLGVFLQARIENLENTPERTVFTVGIRESDGSLGPAGVTPYSLSVRAWVNWYAKHQYELNAQLIREFATSQNNKNNKEDTARFPPEALSLANRTMAQGVDFWHGWFERHDNRIRFLGDIMAEQAGGLSKAQLWLLVGLFLIVMWRLARQALWTPRLLSRGQIESHYSRNRAT
jgi:hypothetical protein